MGAKAGFRCQLKVRGVPAGRARDVKLTADGKEVDVSSRAGGGWKEFLQGLKEWALSVDQVWVADDAQLMALRSAYLAGSQITLRAVDGPYDPTPGWLASTAYALGDCVAKTGAGNAFIYEATDIGSAPHHSDVGEPAWPVVEGGTVVDGDITWTCHAKSATFTCAAPHWVTATVIALGGFNLKTGVANAFVYEATDIGSAPHQTGGGEPAWPVVDGATVVDGDITWTARAKSKGFSGFGICTKVERGEPLEGGLLLPVEIKGTGTLAPV